MLRGFYNCVLYTTATCNLKCRYCYIDKSEALIKIDKMLEESFKGDYYFNFMKDIFYKEELTKIDFWGGEPSYGLVRAIPTIQKAIDYFPNLKEFFMSTNLTTPTVVSDIINFLSVLKDYPYRQFTFKLQLSLDGPTEINDYNRGEKTTEKFTKNFCKLLFELNTFLRENPNITVIGFFKGTWDNDSFKKLQTKEDIINFFKFYESYKEISDSYVETPNWIFDLTVPNTATPSPHTQADGLRFKHTCELINDIVQENESHKIFKYYKNIMPFITGNECDTSDLTNGCHLCGTGSCVVGLLPNRMLSACHSGFTDLLEEYKLLANNKIDPNSELEQGFFKFDDTLRNEFIFTEEEYENQFMKQVSLFDNQNSTFSITTLASLIKTIALAGQIDEKYKNSKEAIKAAHFIFCHTAGCIRDNVSVSNSKFLFQIGFIRLFLNGAKEEIEKNARKNF